MGFRVHLSVICFHLATRYLEMAIGVLSVQFGRVNSEATPQNTILERASTEGTTVESPWGFEVAARVRAQIFTNNGAVLEEVLGSEIAA